MEWVSADNINLPASIRASSRRVDNESIGAFARVYTALDMNRGIMFAVKQVPLDDTTTEGKL